MKIKLPDWQTLPNIALYNDQVMEYVDQIFQPLMLEEHFNITRAMINNYLKVSLVPTYDKKKFNREQLALIIMITFFKPAFTLQEMKQIIEKVPYESVESLYQQFIIANKKNNEDTHPLMFCAVQAVQYKVEILQAINTEQESEDE